MKKIILLSLMVCSCLFSLTDNALAQSLTQIKLQGVEGQLLHDMICLDNKQVYCFLTPEKELASDGKYSIRVYNSDFTKFKEAPNLLEVKSLDYVVGFYNFLCFSKSDGNASNAGNQLIVADTSLKVIKTIHYQLPNPKYKYNDTPLCFFNNDSSCLMVENIIDPTPGKPSPKTNILEYQLSVYSKNLDELLSVYLDFDKIFGKGKEIGNFKFEYVNNSLYLMASTVDNPAVKIQQHFYLVKIEKDGSFKIIHHETFSSGNYIFDYQVIRKNELVISGVLSERVKKFYHFSYNTLGNQGSPKVASYEFITEDKTQKMNIRGLNVYGIANLKMVPARDGYYVYMDINSSEALVEICVMYIDYAGDVKWVNFVARNYVFVYDSKGFLSNGLVKDNNLYLIYHSYDRCILENSDKFSEDLNKGGTQSLILSVITPEQEISSKILYSYKTGKLFWLPYTVISSDNKYYLTGSPVRYVAIYTKSYLGKINLD